MEVALLDASVLQRDLAVEHRREREDDDEQLRHQRFAVMAGTGFDARMIGDADGGLSRRMLGSFLTWLQERQAPVFVAATARSGTQLSGPKFEYAASNRVGESVSRSWMPSCRISTRSSRSASTRRRASATTKAYRCPNCS